MFAPDNGFDFWQQIDPADGAMSSPKVCYSRTICRVFFKMLLPSPLKDNWLSLIKKC